MKNIILITGLALSLSACSSKQAPKEKSTPVFVEANLRIEGMVCDGCEQTIAKGVTQLAGIDSISANHLDSTAFVRFDTTRTNMTQIAAAIEGRGYHFAGEIKSKE